MHNPNLTRFQHSYVEKCGFLTCGINDCCIRGTENVWIPKIDFHTEKWCGNKCTKSERKRLYRREDALFSTTCNFYSDKFITPQTRFCWTLSHINIIIRWRGVSASQEASRIVLSRNRIHSLWNTIARAFLQVGLNVSYLVAPLL